MSEQHANATGRDAKERDVSRAHDPHESHESHESGASHESSATRERSLARSSASLLHALVVLLGFALLLALFFSPVIFRGRLLAPGDGTHFFVPNFYSPRVWWDTLVWAGTPRFADPQAMFWYPPHIICRLLPGGWNIFMLTAYLVAATTTYGYVYHLTRSRLAAALSGTTYALCGFMIVHAGHSSMIQAAAWLPLIVWSLEELRGSAGRRARAWFFVGALAVALSALAGHPQIFLYTLALGGALVLFRARGATHGAARYLIVCAALVVLGVSLAALQLVPTAELTRLTPRAALTFESFTAYQLPARQLPTLIFPLVYGGAPQTFYALPFFGAWGSEAHGWNASEVTGYVGVLPLLLAAVALVSRRERRLVRLWCGVAAVALLLALGSAAPLAYLTYHLPFVNKFRAPARHLLELSFAASVLAGLGANAITRGEVTARQIKLVCLCAFAFALITLAALALGRTQFDAQARAAIGHAVSLAPWKNPATCVPLVVLLASCAAVIWWSRRTSARVRVVVLFVVLVCDLGSLGWFSQWREESPTRASLAPPTTAAQLRDALDASQQRMLAVRGSTGTFDEIPPEPSRLWKVPSASGYGPLMLARMSRLLAMLPHGAVGDFWTDPADRSLDVAAIRYITLPLTGARDGNAQWGDDLNLSLGKSCGAQRESARLALPAPVRATHLAVVSQLACSDQIADGAGVLAVTLHDNAGHAAQLQLAAGRDTSEWAYDCAGVAEHARHRRAPIFSSFESARPPAPCTGHEYVSELATNAPFDVSSIELRWMGGEAGTFALKKLTLVDDERARSYPVSLAAITLGDEARWRPFEQTGDALIYENLRAQPRAWLAGEALTLAPDDVLAAIKTGRLPDGRTFDPARTALLEESQNFLTQNVSTRRDDAHAQSPSPAQASPSAQEESSRADDSSAVQATSPARDDAAQKSVRVVEDSGSKMIVHTDSHAPSLLVLSDAYYPGWRASIDGQDAHIFLTDYALRGVFVPAGTHDVRFELRPRSFRVGFTISCLALAALVIFVAPFNPVWRKHAR